MNQVDSTCNVNLMQLRTLSRQRPLCIESMHYRKKQTGYRKVINHRLCLKMKRMINLTSLDSQSFNAPSDDFANYFLRAIEAAQLTVEHFSKSLTLISFS